MRLNFTESLDQVAQAHGLQGHARFDPASSAIRVLLEPATVQASPLSAAITQRQCTRGDYDGQPLANSDLALPQRASGSATVRMLPLTDRPAIERTLDHVIQGNTAQMADPVFVKELKARLLRFNRSKCRLPVCPHCFGDSFGGRGTDATGGFGAPSSGKRMSPKGRSSPPSRRCISPSNAPAV